MEMRYKKVVTVALCSLLWGGQQMQAQLSQPQNIIDEVVWKIGDESILRSDIENQKILIRNEKTLPSGNIDCTVAEQIAIQMLLLNQAKIDSVTVESTLINRYVEAMLKNMINEIGSEQKLEEYFNKPLSQIREEQRRLTTNSEIARSMRSKIIKNVQVTPTEIRSFFATQKQDSLPYIPATVEVQMLRIRPEIPLQEIDRIKERLLDFSNQINSGEREFSSLARLYSQDQRSALQGGEYGFVGKASLEPDFARTVFNMTPGRRVSPIIKTEQGYHIVQLIEKRGDAVNFRHILLRPEVSTEILETEVARLDSVLVEIENNKLTFDKAVDLFASDEDSKNNSGIMLNSNYQSERNGSSYFTLEELPQEVGLQVDKLKPGERSKPFILRSAQGNTEVAIVLLKSYSPGHRANLTDDFQIIKAMALEQKKQQEFDKWINDRLSKTYVFIAPEYQSCDFKYKGWIH